VWIIKVTVGDSFFWHDASFVCGAAGTFPRSYKSQVDIAFKFNTGNTVLFAGLKKNPTVGSPYLWYNLYVNHAQPPVSFFLILSLQFEQV
jgi:hypothetical protein